MAAAVPATGRAVTAVLAVVRIPAVLAVRIRAAGAAARTDVHTFSHPMRGQKVKLKCGVYFQLGDWWDSFGYGPWIENMHNPVCVNYGLMVVAANLPRDDEVVFGTIDGLGYMVHESELDL